MKTDFWHKQNMFNCILWYSNKCLLNMSSLVCDELNTVGFSAHFNHYKGHNNDLLSITHTKPNCFLLNH